ncbi:MAG: hypothetical protein OXS30_10795 [Chloroflexota bacterium]|nr:hypothetical protein [Chloroflexota bacterium]
MALHHPDPEIASPRGHYVFVDGPSIDGTLGRVIGQPPGPDTRPDWRRLETFVKQHCGPAPYLATFVFWAPGQQGFMHFLRTSGFMIALGDRFTPGQSCADLIRERISRLNDAADGEQEWQVIVGTHNPDLIAELPELASEAERVTVFGFTEFLPDTPELEESIDFYDIEDDAQLFRTPLPRVEFDDELEDSSVADPDMAYQPTLVRPPAPERQTPTFAPRPLGDVRDFYLIVDGRSIEKELGEILGEKPNPGTRPDWGTVLDFARSQTNAADGEVRALFAHIAPGHAGFRRALKDLGYTSSPVRLDDAQPMRPVVEEFICGLLGARAFRGEAGDEPAPDIMVIGHGQAIFEALSDIPDRGQRLCALGFPERMPSVESYPRIEQLDLERDAQAFGAELPREFGVDVDNFDPDEELSKLF